MPPLSSPSRPVNKESFVTTKSEVRRRKKEKVVRPVKK
jgi:hypothetical protein